MAAVLGAGSAKLLTTLEVVLGHHLADELLEAGVAVLALLEREFLSFEFVLQVGDLLFQESLSVGGELAEFFLFLRVPVEFGVEIAQLLLKLLDLVGLECQL